MEITGKLTVVLDAEQGESAKGGWIKRSIVLQQSGEYGKPVCIMFWGDKCDQIDTMKLGDTLTVAVNVESREYNGRYFTDIKAWKVTSSESEIEKTGTQEESDNLPF